MYQANRRSPDVRNSFYLAYDISVRTQRSGNENLPPPGVRVGLELGNPMTSTVEVAKSDVDMSGVEENGELKLPFSNNQRSSSFYCIL